jgi:endo-1,3(4)-beta-glucanase
MSRPLCRPLLLASLLPVLFHLPAHAEIVSVGVGSYTTTFPGTDVAGRNGFPAGTPQLSGPAVGRPVPTNDWWSGLLQRNHVSNLFNYPLAMRTLPAGLDLGWVVPASGVNGSSQPLSDVSPIIVGVSGLAAGRATVHDYTDWTVTIAWDSGDHALRALTGIGMPFVYFTKASGDTASVTVNVGNVTIQGERLLITQSQGGSHFAVYGPSGSVWTAAGKTYTSTLAGKNYWSVAFLPPGADPATSAAAWQAHAHVVPTGTRVDWSYDASTSTVRTEFTTLVEVREGEGTSVLQGLLPHHWAHLAPDSPSPAAGALPSIRGELKLLAGNQFATERRFHGILPTLPARAAHSEGFDPARLHGKIALLENESLATWTDSYNDGQLLNRLVQTARVAHETGNLEARDKLIATVRERVEDWLTAEPGEVAFLFHYQSQWQALLGYPAGHGQDSNLNDHHFHWGYFIHAAAFLEQFLPGWAADWGGMIDLLIRDASSPDRADPLFPFLRSFSPFAGHCWANGFATFPFGNDQESSSESMQFHSSLIHWGMVTGDDAVRDLGIYLYTTEQSAIEEYWLDTRERTFKPGYGFALASRVWGNGYDNQTFWTSDIAAAYGIELYPIHAGSFYLAHDTAYAQRLWGEMAANTGILAQAVNVNLWHDVYWQFLAFLDPAAALALYEGNPNRELKFGISDAQTYYWLHAMNALGRIDATVTADHPLAVVFATGETRTYVAQNYGSTARTVNFSDGASLLVPPRSLATSADLPVSGTLVTPFPVAPTGNTVALDVSLDGAAEIVTAVEFFRGNESLGSVSTPPFALQSGPLPPGRHHFHARLHAGGTFATTNLTSVVVGAQLPLTGVPHAVPGTIEAGAYDRFEGGSGEGIAYHDNSPGNNGDYRPAENVDASQDTTEGTVVGWIADGEWLEYTLAVETSGLYRCDFRYASNNAGGGGPFHFVLEGERISPDQTVPSTGNWAVFADASLEGIELPAGTHVLRLQFTRGELNLGRMSFVRTGPLATEPPFVAAGADRALTAPATSLFLDSASASDPGGQPLSLQWTQVFGPAAATLAGANTLQAEVSGLTRDGVYRFELRADNGGRTSRDTIDVVRGELAALPPVVMLLEPTASTPALAGRPLAINVAASDADGTVTLVELFSGDLFLGARATPPYHFSWSPPVGTHSLRARAFDNDGFATFSTPVSVIASPPLPCSGTSASGNFDYEFSSDAANPTLTFHPARAGVGASLVLLYYGKGSGPYPGYAVTPGVPFRLTAAEGETIGFYFTYSVPEGGERNSLAENARYTIGTCAEASTEGPEEALLAWRSLHFSALELNDPALEADLWGDEADPDGDGLRNFLEFATGEDPLLPSPLPLFWQLGNLDEAASLRFSLREDLLPGAKLQWSENLLLWHDASSPLRPLAQDGPFLHLDAALGAEGSGEPRFYRLLLGVP